MPGRGAGGHHRNSNSLSTIPAALHPQQQTLWMSGTAFAVVSQQQQQQQHVNNTFTQMLESTSTSASQQPGEANASFEEEQFFDHRGYYGSSGV